MLGPTVYVLTPDWWGFRLKRRERYPTVLVDRPTSYFYFFHSSRREKRSILHNWNYLIGEDVLGAVYRSGFFFINAYVVTDFLICDSFYSKNNMEWNIYSNVHWSSNKFVAISLILISVCALFEEYWRLLPSLIYKLSKHVLFFNNFAPRVFQEDVNDGNLFPSFINSISLWWWSNVIRCCLAYKRSPWSRHFTTLSHSKRFYPKIFHNCPARTMGSAKPKLFLQHWAAGK